MLWNSCLSMAFKSRMIATMILSTVYKSLALRQPGGNHCQDVICHHVAKKKESVEELTFVMTNASNYDFENFQRISFHEKPVICQRWARPNSYNFLDF